MSQGFLRKIIGGWRLERKFLLLLGLALVTSILLAFFAVQAVAARLVVETARRTARDVAKSYIFGEHVEAVLAFSPATTDSNRVAVLRELRKDMLSTDFSFELFRLGDQIEFDDLGGRVPTSPIDRELLQKIESAMLQAKTLEDSQVAIDQPAAAEEDLEATLTSLTGPKPSDLFFQEYGPVGDFYYYYYPIAFKRSCLDCHAPRVIGDAASLEAFIPFRVLRVKMPYTETRLWTIWSYSIMLAVGLATLALSLFFIHWILHGLVIRPLKHLRDISDEVSKGNLSLRSEIDTADEFNDLSDAFNRMLRHLTDTQVEVQKVNTELDKRVDQLAQLNLQLYEANRLKSDFLANMSHELRTPLNSILGFSDVLQGFDTLTEKQKRYAGNIQKSGRLLLEMINDILDLAKVEAGKMEVRASTFDLFPLVEGQCDVVRPFAEDKNIDLQIDWRFPLAAAALPEEAAGVDPTIATSSPLPALIVEQDQAKIQQILTNLLSNAIKFTPQGGIITVSVSPGEEGFFSLTVTDTGVGIAEHDHEAIFEKFRQVHTNANSDGLTREYSGTGLGLSIVRELCRLLGGEISLHSQLGKGSSFTVSLPRRYQRPLDAGSTEFPPPAAASPSVPGRFSYP
jgi:two-component system sensor histidine kinase BarA